MRSCIFGVLLRDFDGERQKSLLANLTMDGIVARASAGPQGKGSASDNGGQPREAGPKNQSHNLGKKSLVRTWWWRCPQRIPTQSPGQPHCLRLCIPLL